MLVKICGLRSVEHALAAAAAGADMIGLVFAPSRRQVSPAEGAAVAAALRALGPRRPRVVGLFVNEAPGAIAAVAATVGLDAVQLSGDEPADDAAAIGLPLLKALRLDGSAREAAWLERAGPGCMPLVDAHVPGAYGGTGVIADWDRAAALAAATPILLAGGLTPANVAAAIVAVRPRGVDVSSGVERDGVKDPAMIEAFIEAARSAR
jgi:phosphoribosylanthranilate isomerase